MVKSDTEKASAASIIVIALLATTRFVFTELQSYSDAGQLDGGCFWIVIGKQHGNPEPGTDQEDHSPDSMGLCNGVLRLTRFLACDHGERYILPMPECVPAKTNKVHRYQRHQTPGEGFVKFLDALSPVSDAR